MNEDDEKDIDEEASTQVQEYFFFFRSPLRSFTQLCTKESKLSKFLTNIIYISGKQDCGEEKKKQFSIGEFYKKKLENMLSHGSVIMHL